MKERVELLPDKENIIRQKREDIERLLLKSQMRARRLTGVEKDYAERQAELLKLQLETFDQYRNANLDKIKKAIDETLKEILKDEHFELGVLPSQEERIERIIQAGLAKLKILHWFKKLLSSESQGNN